MKAKGFVPEGTVSHARPDWIPAWNELTPEEKKRSARDMEVYAAMVDRIDENVGRLIAVLKELGKFDETLIMVMTVNSCIQTI